MSNLYLGVEHATTIMILVDIDCLMQKSRNSSAFAMELRLFALSQNVPKDLISRSLVDILSWNAQAYLFSTSLLSCESRWQRDGRVRVMWV